MEDSNLVTLELLKPLIFKAGFQGLSAFLPKWERIMIFCGGGEWGVLRSFPAGSEVSREYCGVSGSIILEMWELLHLIEGWWKEKRTLSAVINGMPNSSACRNRGSLPPLWRYCKCINPGLLDSVISPGSGFGKYPFQCWFPWLFLSGHRMAIVM